MHGVTMKFSHVIHYYEHTML